MRRRRRRRRRRKEEEAAGAELKTKTPDTDVGNLIHQGHDRYILNDEDVFDHKCELSC